MSICRPQALVLNAATASRAGILSSRPSAASSAAAALANHSPQGTDASLAIDNLLGVDE